MQPSAKQMVHRLEKAKDTPSLQNQPSFTDPIGLLTATF